MAEAGDKDGVAVEQPGVEQPGEGASVDTAAEAETKNAARIARLREKSENIPPKPGVYLFRDQRRKVIYVGKAKSLRARVRSYVLGGDGRYQVRFLMDRACDIETLVTATETEALILENNLIKQYKPRYNINLKDDKTYVSVKVTTRDDWPRLIVTRKIQRDGNTYLGPFASASAVRETVATIRKVFPLRTCSDTVFRNRSRPCLEHQIHRCMAPCVLKVDREDYEGYLQNAVQLLEGKTDILTKQLEAKMLEAAEGERFEEAARHRDRMLAVGKVAERQKVLVHGGGDRDVFGLYREGGFLDVQVLLVRSGKLVGNHSYHLEDHEFPDEEVLSSLLGRFYQGERFVPDEILLPFAVEAMEPLAEYLGELRKRKVTILVPQRGEKRRLVEMAEENAAHAFGERNDESTRRDKMLDELCRRLALPGVPKRIECFDISHSQGEHVVASMVAFDEGLPDKSGYRRYKLREVQRNDDFAAMKEVLGRRLRRGKDEGGLPDLILIDGGKGQLAMASEAMAELGVEGVELASIAKDRVRSDVRGEELVHSEERIFRPGRTNPVNLRRNSSALFLLQQVRDEAHRFAITFHRELRSKSRLRSEIDDIPGVGPARRRVLLKTFGSVRKIAEADLEQVAAVPGVGRELAGQILAALKKNRDKG